MYPFELRDRNIRVESAEVYPNSQWGGVAESVIANQVLKICVVILTTRRRGDTRQVPYVYVDDEPDSGRGLWLEEASYELLEDQQPEL